MKLLLDTHILLWSLTGSGEISQTVWDMIKSLDNEVYYSTASVWEVTIKHMAKPDKMLISGTALADKCDAVGFQMLPIVNDHVRYLETLKRGKDAKPHNDPFDRIMIAQAKAERMRFVTHDSLIPDYGESCVMYV